MFYAVNYDRYGTQTITAYRVTSGSPPDIEVMWESGAVQSATIYGFDEDENFYYACTPTWPNHEIWKVSPEGVATLLHTPAAVWTNNTLMSPQGVLWVSRYVSSTGLYQLSRADLNASTYSVEDVGPEKAWADAVNPLAADASGCYGIIVPPSASQGEFDLIHVSAGGVETTTSYAHDVVSTLSSLRLSADAKLLAVFVRDGDNGVFVGALPEGGGAVETTRLSTGWIVSTHPAKVFAFNERFAIGVNDFSPALKWSIDGGGDMDFVPGVLGTHAFALPATAPPVPVCFWTDLINATQVCSTPPRIGGLT